MSAPPATPHRPPPSFRRLLRSWYALTRTEQGAILLITLLFLLGVTLRFWKIVMVRP